MTTAPTSHPTLAETPGHAHLADLGGCLDLINSVELTDGVAEEHLPTVDDVVAYFTLRGLAHEDALRAEAHQDAQAWLDRVYATRAALREVWDAAVEGRAAAGAAVDTLNGVLAHSPQPRLRAGLTGVVVDHAHEPDATAEALARVALSLVDALAGGDVGRFRICANDGCRWVFEDTSRGGRRRWCDMSSCGNRAKVRRFRSKQRESSPPESSPPESSPPGPGQV